MNNHDDLKIPEKVREESIVHVVYYKEYKWVGCTYGSYEWVETQLGLYKTKEKADLECDKLNSELKSQHEEKYSVDWLEVIE